MTYTKKLDIPLPCLNVTISQHIRPIWSRNFHQTTTFYGKQLLRKLRDDDIDPLTIRKPTTTTTTTTSKSTQETIGRI